MVIEMKKITLTLIAVTGICSLAQAGDLRPIPVSKATCFGKLSTITVPSFPGSTEKPKKEKICEGRINVKRHGEEVSALLLNSNFMAMVTNASAEAQARSQVLILDGFTMTWSGVVKTVEAHFSTRSMIDPNSKKSPLGQIQGQLMMDEAGNLVTEAISNTFYDDQSGNSK